MNFQYLKPVSPDAPHPFLKDSDGGALMVNGDEPNQPHNSKVWTAKAIADAIETERRCREWQLSARGVQWLKAQSHFTMEWAVARFGPELAARFN